MWVIKRADGKYYSGLMDNVVWYVPAREWAKTFSEDEKENIILFSNEMWVEVGAP